MRKSFIRKSAFFGSAGVCISVLGLFGTAVLGLYDVYFDNGIYLFFPFSHTAIKVLVVFFMLLFAISNFLFFWGSLSDSIIESIASDGIFLIMGLGIMELFVDTILREFFAMNAKSFFLWYGIPCMIAVIILAFSDSKRNKMPNF